MTVAVDQLRILVRTHADEIAYRVRRPDGETSTTFGAWDATASRLARALVAAGVAAGDRVALLVEPAEALRFLAAYAAIHKAGAVAVPVHSSWSAAEVRAVLEHAQARLVFVSPSLAAVAAEAVAGSACRQVSTDWDGFLAGDASDIQVPVGSADIADIVYTSGTTGAAKGVVVRHGQATQLPVGEPHWTGMRWFHASPLTTTAGLSFVYLPMRMGMSAVYQPRFDPAGFLELVEGGEADMAFLVPAMVELVLAQPGIDGRDLSALRLVTVGSAPSAPATLLALDDLLPHGHVVNGFSLTETGAQIVLPADELRKRPDSVGKPLPPAEVKVVGDDGADVAAGQVGEICVRTARGGREYYRDPAATAAAWRDGWLHTGDLGRLDEDGFLYVVGRKKDVVIRGGHNVHAADVEAVLYAHPDVAEAAVVGVPHPVLGEDVAAVVVPRHGATTTVEELAEWCAAALARYKVPRRFELRARLPRTDSGKVLKRQLREELAGG